MKGPKELAMMKIVNLTGKAFALRCMTGGILIVQPEKNPVTLDTEDKQVQVIKVDGAPNGFTIQVNETHSNIRMLPFLDYKSIYVVPLHVRYHLGSENIMSVRPLGTTDTVYCDLLGEQVQICELFRNATNKGAHYSSSGN